MPTLPAASVFVQQCEQARQTFYRQNAHLGEGTCHQLWAQKETEIVSSLLNPTIPQGYDTSRHSSHFQQQLAAARAAMQHSQTHQQHSSGRTKRTRSAPAMAAPTHVQEFEPAMFVAQQAALSAQQQSRLDVPNMSFGQFGNVAECSLPASPMSMTNASTFDGPMSRSTSLGGPFEKLSIGSSMSSFSYAEDSPFNDYAFSSVKSDDLTESARSHLICNSFADDMSSPTSLYPPSMSATMSMHSQQSSSGLHPINEAFESIPMSIQLSTTSHSSDSSQQQYSRMAQTRPPVSSRPSSTSQRSSASATGQPTASVGQHVAHLIDIASADGRGIRSVASIPRAAYRRPAKEKLYCDKCNDHPDGFRGDHELTRHIQRHHSEVRKCWMAVDRSEDGKWLQNCKHCRTGKKYYAYYNLAAHLRRIHFNKKEKSGRGRRKRGAPIPESEKKGGKSGGDQPSIDWLKDNGWIEEVDEFVVDDAPIPVDKFDDDDDLCMDGINAHYEPAYADANWHPTLGDIDLNAQPYLVSGFALTPDESNFANTYTTGGGFGGQDFSYSNYSTQQQVHPTAFSSHLFMQQ